SSLLMASVISCTSDFDEINTRPDALTSSDISAKFLVTDVQQKLIAQNTFGVWLGNMLHPDLVSDVFDERNEAVTESIKKVIKVCKSKGKYIGICGQAPSDYPEVTQMLVEEGIDSISLNPDSALKMREVVLAIEKQLN
ncbi:MAG: hypothetical protein K0U47_10950, partial [Epsilonproteobacteria bacterium]|nr:hypothetical protein [Campylobacterota bacterium]